jgi:hypothetical protein
VNVRMVTVSRQLGTNGEKIARCVADELGFRYFDDEVIQRAAKVAGVPLQAVISAEHAPSFKQRMVEALSGNRGLTSLAWYDPTPLLSNPLYTSEHYRALIYEVLRALAKEGDAVVLGHAAQIVLNNRWDTLKVLISGSVPLRALRVREMGIADDGAAALRVITNSDNERTSFFDRFHGVTWLSAVNYDICLNTDHIRVPQAVELICEAARQR